MSNAELEEYRLRIDQQIEAMGNGWIHPIDESAGLRFDRYNRRWEIKLAGRTDPNAWICEAGFDYALSWAIRAIRDDQVAPFLAKIDAPRDAILELLHYADLFVAAEQKADESA